MNISPILYLYFIPLTISVMLFGLIGYRMYNEDIKSSPNDNFTPTLTWSKICFCLFFSMVPIINWFVSGGLILSKLMEYDCGLVKPKQKEN